VLDELTGFIAVASQAFTGLRGMLLPHLAEQLVSLLWAIRVIMMVKQAMATEIIMAAATRSLPSSLVKPLPSIIH
jgi:hypothetical protein